MNDLFDFCYACACKINNGLDFCIMIPKHVWLNTQSAIGTIGNSVFVLLENIGRSSLLMQGNNDSHFIFNALKLSYTGCHKMVLEF